MLEDRGAATRWIPVWRRNLRVWTKLLGPALLGNLVEPLLYLLALGFGLGRLVGQVSDIPYVVFLASGILCSSTMYTASFEAMYSAYTRMAVQQTWQAMLATPLDLRDIVIGEAVWSGTKSLFSAAAILLVAGLLGAVHDLRAVWVFPIALLTGVTFAAMGLVVTALARSYDFFLYYTTLIVTPMLLFGGVFFPMQGLPPGIRAVAEMFPLYHAVRLVRPLMTGQVLQDVALHVTVIILWAASALLLSLRLLERRLMA